MSSETLKVDTENNVLQAGSASVYRRKSWSNLFVRWSEFVSVATLTRVAHSKRNNVSEALSCSRPFQVQSREQVSLRCNGFIEK
jgi:hypothetical protein